MFKHKLTITQKKKLVSLQTFLFGWICGHNRYFSYKKKASRKTWLLTPWFEVLPPALEDVLKFFAAHLQHRYYNRSPTTVTEVKAREPWTHGDCETTAKEIWALEIWMFAHYTFIKHLKMFHPSCATTVPCSNTFFYTSFFICTDSGFKAGNCHRWTNCKKVLIALSLESAHQSALLVVLKISMLHSAENIVQPKTVQYMQPSHPLRVRTFCYVGVNLEPLL